MPALSVVEAFKVTEDAGSSLLAVSVVCAVDLLSFQGSEERFDDRVVITVALTRHTLRDAVGLKSVSKGVAGILSALDGMV